MPVTLSSGGLGQTVLDPPPEAAATQLAATRQLPTEERTEAVAAVAAKWPTMLGAWAELGLMALEAGRVVDAYAYFRVGYHRGLDALRAAGWRGSGYVRWAAPTNHGFLWSLWGLGKAAEAIGETAEAKRCSDFLTQLDPTGPPQSPQDSV